MFPFRKVQLIPSFSLSRTIIGMSFPFRKVQLILIFALIIWQSSLFPFRKVQLIQKPSNGYYLRTHCFHSARYN